MTKIGGLLQVGFGEAGGAIIAKNMRLHGRLDCLIPGAKVGDRAAFWGASFLRVCASTADTRS